MRKLKDKNLPQAFEAINKANFQSDAKILEQLQKGTKLELSEPKISDAELHDIQKFANSGLNGLQNIMDSTEANKVEAVLSLRQAELSKQNQSQRGVGATGHLLSSVKSIKDDLLSTISQNQQNRKNSHLAPSSAGLLGKRQRQQPHASTQKLMKDAADILVLNQSQSALLGGENPQLNNPLMKAGSSKVDHSENGQSVIRDEESELDREQQSEIGDSVSQMNPKQQRLNHSNLKNIPF